MNLPPVLTAKLGPLPRWGWIAGGTALVVGFLVLRRGSGSSGSGTATQYLPIPGGVGSGSGGSGGSDVPTTPAPIPTPVPTLPTTPTIPVPRIPGIPQLPRIPRIPIPTIPRPSQPAPAPVPGSGVVTIAPVEHDMMGLGLVSLFERAGNTNQEKSRAAYDWVLGQEGAFGGHNFQSGEIYGKSQADDPSGALTQQLVNMGMFGTPQTAGLVAGTPSDPGSIFGAFTGSAARTDPNSPTGWVYEAWRDGELIGSETIPTNYDSVAMNRKYGVGNY